MLYYTYVNDRYLIEGMVSYEQRRAKEMTAAIHTRCRAFAGRSYPRDECSFIYDTFDWRAVRIFQHEDSFKTNADLIVEMKKTGGKSFKYEGVAFTLSTGSVTAIYQGKLADKKEIKILETGDVVHHIKYTFEGHEVLKNNDTAIVFLRKYSGPATDEEAYVILGEFQGKFKLDAEGNIIEPHKYLSEPLKSIRSKSELEKLLH